MIIWLVFSFYSFHIQLLKFVVVVVDFNIFNDNVWNFILDLENCCELIILQGQFTSMFIKHSP